MKQRIAFSLLSLLSLLLPAQAQEQQRDSVAWDLDLAELFVYERATTKESGANAGAKVERIAPQTLEVFQSRSLAELLADNTAVHIKSLGLGALATASFRGAGAQQTRVLWNGIDLTPAMSGIFDFSQMPVFFADRVSLVYGSSDSKTGTGAIGGSVNLATLPSWDGTEHFTLAAELGSYATYNLRGTAQYGTRRFSGKTRAYLQHSDNSYEYLNKVSSGTPFLERREDASYTMGSAMQEVSFRLGDRDFLSSALWYQQGVRMLPQPLGVETTTHEEQGETNLRAYLGYDHHTDRSSLALKAAYIYYKMRYDKWFDSDYFEPQGNTNSSHTYHLSADYTYRPSDRLTLNTALTYRHDVARAESYREIDPDNYIVDGEEFDHPTVLPAVHRYRNTLSWHNSARWQFTPRWLADLRLMVEQVDRRKPVVTYSLGAVGSLIPHRLSLRSSVAYNYRFPTLNEMYWRPGGNPDVRPEHGFSGDLSLSYAQQLGRHWLLSTELSGYLLLIDDWILWLPADEESGAFTKGEGRNQWLWTPQNKRDVLSDGAEAVAKLTYVLRDLKVTGAFNYSYTMSRTRTRQTEDDGSYLMQIPYVPRQKWNVSLTTDYRRFFLTLRTSYVGVRYVTTDQSYFTYPYNVTQLSLGYTWLLPHGMSLSPQLRVDNLFNTYYESTQYYPMPRRNILGTLLFTF